MSRHMFCFDHLIFRSSLFILLAGFVLLLTTTVANAAETAPTPTAGEYALATKPAPERQPVTSTSADLRLATGVSIAAAVVMTVVVLSERGTAANDTQQVTPAPRQPSVVRTIRPAEAMPEAA